eukprot:g1932.t1
MSSRRRVPSGAGIPSRKNQEYDRRQAEEHRALARDGLLRCFACGESCPPNLVKCHPKLSVHVCPDCYNVYHEGAFEVADDGHEIYCRMCGDGGTIITCDERDPKTRRPCPFSFCLDCIERNFGAEEKVHSSNNFRCWICDDSRMEQLRRRIPGYEPNSKRVLTRLITTLKQVAPVKETDRAQDASSRSHGITNAATAAAAKGNLPSKRKPKKASSRRHAPSSSAAAVAASRTSGESNHRPSAPFPFRGRRSPPPSPAHGDAGALGSCGSEEHADEEEEDSEGVGSFEEEFGGRAGGAGVAEGKAGGSGGGAAGQQRRGGSSARNGASLPAAATAAAAAQGGFLRIAARPPAGPGRGATLLPPCGDDSDGGSSAAASAEAFWYHPRKSSLQRRQRQRWRRRRQGKWEGSSSSDGLSTDSSDDDSSDCGHNAGSGSCSGGGGGLSRGGCRGGGVGGSNVGGGAQERPGVFGWDRRSSNGRQGGTRATRRHRPAFSIDDLSRGMEQVKIQVTNSEDDEKLPYFRYVTGYVMGGEVQQKTDPDAMVCCDCTDGCRDPSICACLRLRAGKGGTVHQTAADGVGTGGASQGGSVGAAAERGEGEGGAGDEGPGRRRFYNDDGLLLHLPNAIFECGARCACNPHKCKNRVVSRGVHLRLQVFRCKRDEGGFDKGWGLRCLDRIPAGSFVACYLGEVLTDRSVDDRGKQTHDDYVFGLDFAQCASQKAGAGDWGLASPFTPSPRTNGGGAAAAATAAGTSRNLSSISPGGTLAEVGGGGVRERPSLSLSPPSTLRNGGAPARKKPKRSVRSPLAAAEAAAVVGATAAPPAPPEAAVGGESEAAAPPEQEVLDGSVLAAPGKKTLEAFMGVTGVLDRKRAAFFVAGADGKLERAVNHFFENPAAGGAAAAGTVGGAGRGEILGVGDDADDEREESDDNENDNHPAVATAGSSGSASGRGSNPAGNVSMEDESMPEGLSGQERQRWIYEHNERERLAYRRQQEEETAARLRPQQKPVDPSVPPGSALPTPLPGGGIGSSNGNTAKGNPLAPRAAVPSSPPLEEMEDGDSVTAWSGGATVGGAPENKTVSPPSSPAEVLWQELEVGGGDDDAAGEVARLAGGFSSASVAPAGTALISELRAGSPPRNFGGGGDGVDAAAVVVVDQPASANVLPCLASPLKLGPAFSPESSGSTTAQEQPITINRERSSNAAPSTPPPPRWTVETTPKRTGEQETATAGATGGAAAGGTASGSSERDEEDLPDAWRPAREEEEVGGSPSGDASGGMGGWMDAAAPPSPSAPSTPYSPRSDRSAEMVVDAKTYGNVARFMNHSCDGNLIKKMVFVESHESRMPRVAFFAPDCIEPYEELTYDYNYKIGSVEGTNLDCHCGAGENCRGRLL